MRAYVRTPNVHVLPIGPHRVRHGAAPLLGPRARRHGHDGARREEEEQGRVQRGRQRAPAATGPAAPSARHDANGGLGLGRRLLAPFRPAAAASPRAARPL